MRNQDMLAAIALRAEQGDIDAQFKLGKAYLLNGCSKTDRAPGLEWLERAAVKGSA